MAAGFVGACGGVSKRSSKATLCTRPSRRMTTTAMADQQPQEQKKGGNPFGMFGQMGKIMDAVKKAQEFTKDAKTLQDELRKTELDTSVRDGAVKVKISGNQVPIKVEVSKDLLEKGPEEVSAACTEAFQEAHRVSLEYMQNNLNELTNSFGLPQNMQNMPPPQQ